MNADKECISYVVELQDRIQMLKGKLMAADGMAKAIDTMIERRALNPRSPVADARLDYGDPGKYEFCKQLANDNSNHGVIMENDKKDALDRAFDAFLFLLRAPAGATGIEFFNEQEYSVMDINAARLRFREAMFKTLQHPNMALGAYGKGTIPIIHANRLPALDECRDYCRRSVTDKKLDPTDEHMIGTMWAYIEGRLGINPET